MELKSTKLFEYDATGKIITSFREQADELFIAIHSIPTHLKIISQKTDCHSFAPLLKFAIALGLS